MQMLSKCLIPYNWGCLSSNSRCIGNQKACRMRYLGYFFITLVLIGYAPHVPARLQLIEIVAHNGHFDVYFNSDINFLTLHNQNKYQNATSTSLVCQLDGRTNRIDADGPAPARGSIEYIGMQISASRTSYRFKSHLVFYKHEETNPDVYFSMTPQDIETALSANINVPCKVQILAYFPRRYFSETLGIPSDKFKSLARQGKLTE